MNTKPMTPAAADPADRLRAALADLATTWEEATEPLTGVFGADRDSSDPRQRGLAWTAWGRAKQLLDCAVELRTHLEET